MVALETEYRLAQQGIGEREVQDDTETYIFLFNKRGEIFMSGNKKTGFDTMHGNIDSKISVGEWIINELYERGLSDEDLKGLNLYNDTHKIEFHGRKIEIVGILCDSEACWKLSNSQGDPGAFFPAMYIDVLDKKRPASNKLVELIDRLSVDGVIDRPEIFVPEV